MRNEQANLRYPDLSGAGFPREPRVLDGDQEAETDMVGQRLVQQTGRIGVVGPRRKQTGASRCTRMSTEAGVVWIPLSGGYRTQ